MDLWWDDASYQAYQTDNGGEGEYVPQHAGLVMENRYMPKDENLAERVAAYLPANYHAHRSMVNGESRVVIYGDDVAGWTWHDYVVPRLASGLVFVEKVDPYTMEVL